MRVYSSFEKLEALPGNGRNRILLAGEEIPYVQRKQITAGKKIVLTQSQCADLGEEEKELPRYQSAERLTAGIAFGNGRKPFGLLVVGRVRLSAGIACQQWAQAVRLACYGVGLRLAAGIACRQGLAGSALHPQGTSSLDPVRCKLFVLLGWVRLCLLASDRLWR